MYPYLRTYQLAASLARANMKAFDIPPARRFSYGVKSCNLAACFLGFSVREDERFYRKSAELGFLASTFDLVSDGLHFDSDAFRTYGNLVRALVEPEVAEITLGLMERKRQGRLGAQGLERGIESLRIIIKHLGVEEYWQSEEDLNQVGILCQVVDDVLDFENDIARRELNFIGKLDFKEHLHLLSTWDYKRQFQLSRYPLVLFHVISIAKAKSRRLLIDFASRDSTLTPGSVLEASQHEG
jgi:hypothetical protein